MTKSEAQTRSELIDQQLALAGWNVKDPTQVVEEFDILTALPDGVAEPRTAYEGHQFSDYVLLGKDGKPLAVIEAKKTSRDAAIGREQAKQYCYNIQKQLGGELPFCFYTNGHELYFWDLENAPPRKVIGFPTRDDLERFTYIRRNRKPLTQEFINTSIAGRDYQTNPWFVWGHLNSKFGKTRLSNLCRNIVGMANINAKELQAIPILKPPAEFQNQFAAIVEKVEALKSGYQQSLTDLQALYGALSQQAFKGELDLSRVPLPKDESHENDQSLNMQKNRLGVR